MLSRVASAGRGGRMPLESVAECLSERVAECRWNQWPNGAGIRKPAPDVLQRLSDGTGVPVAHLEPMTLAHVWVRLLDQLRQFAATPEGEAELERLIGQRLSQNS